VTLLLWFFGISLIPLGLVSLIGYERAASSRTEEIGSRLAAVSDVKMRSLQAFFSNSLRELDQQTRLEANFQLMGGLQASLQMSGRDVSRWTRSEDWRDLNLELGRELNRFRSHSPYYDIMMVDTEGRVLFTCNERDNLGTDLFRGLFAGSVLGETCRKALGQAGPVFSGFAAYQPSGEGISAYLVQSMLGADGSPVGLLVFQITNEPLDELVSSRSLLGGAGQTYLVNEQLQLLTVPVRQSWLEVLREPVASEQTLRWRRTFARKADESPNEDERNDYSGPPVWEYLGPGDETVIGIHQNLNVHGVDIGVISEISRTAAQAGLNRMRLAMVALLVLVILVVVLAGLVVSRRIVLPLVHLGRVMQRVADGHEVRNLHVDGHNEVGDLADQFAVMIEKLTEAKLVNDRQFRLQHSQFELNEKMRGEPDPDTLAGAILDYIGNFYSAQVGAFYLVRPGHRLNLVAEFGVADEQGLAGEIKIGQGVAGTAALGGEVHVLRDVPPGHLEVRTGLGVSPPRCLIVAPFHLAGQIKGVLELGTMENVPEQDLEFLRLCAENVAVALDSARSRARVHRLLEETRRQAGALSRQRKALQDKNAELARTDRYKSEFLANMSHELRTPLNSLLIMSQVLSENRKENLAGDEVEAAVTINQAGTDLLTIINDILDLSRVEPGQLELYEEPVVLTDLTTSMRDLFKPVAERAELDFRVVQGPDLPVAVKTDQLRVSQVLKNLLNNAFKFTTAGSVVLRVRRPGPGELAGLVGPDQGRWLAFSVSDTGIGMNGETVAHVFEAFNQGDGSIGRRFGGSGLGLSISRKFADLLGGQITVESVEGKGSTFTLFLPAEAVVEADLEAAVAGGPRRRDQASILLTPPELGSVAQEDVDEESEGLATAAETEIESTDLAGCKIVICDRDMRAVYRLSDELDALRARVLIARGPEACEALLAQNPDVVMVIYNPDLGWTGSDADGNPQPKANSSTAPVFVALVDESGVEAVDADRTVLGKPIDRATLVQVVEVLTSEQCVAPAARIG